MSQANALQSLDLILEDVSAEINLSINALEQYSRKPENVSALKKSSLHLNKLKGVFTLLEMVGAERLVKDAMMLIKKLPNLAKESRQELLTIVSTSLARLMRYTEHVNQKPYDLPQLLLPAINSIRGAINAPLLSEAVFFDCDFNFPRPNKITSLVTSEESAEKSRHFRQMYQIGLIEVLRQTNLIGGLRMMQKALTKLDQECPRPNFPNTWWIAEAMLDGYIEGTLVLTKNRIKMFSRIDRQIRQVENKPQNLLQNNRAETAVLNREMLYLVVISKAASERANAVLSHFKLESSAISDALIRQETQEMRGPSDHDYGTVSEALLDEIKSITLALKNTTENALEELDLEQTLKQLSNLDSLLKILQVNDQRVRLNVAMELVEKAIADCQPLPEKDINILLIVLESIGKVVNESDLAKYSGNTAPKRQKLTDNQAKIRTQAYASVKNLIKAFEEFNQQNRKVLLLKDVHQMLDELRLNFKQLKLSNAVRITEGCLVFIDHHLTNNPHTTSSNAINLFADIISSFEFYLETMKHTATPSEKIFEFAENSLLHLNRESKVNTTKA
ncbi:hypothetical protein ACUR5C_03540 [Aliikangiella sp. IMCC44653]